MSQIADPKRSEIHDELEHIRHEMYCSGMLVHAAFLTLTGCTPPDNKAKEMAEVLVGVGDDMALEALTRFDKVHQAILDSDKESDKKDAA